MQLLTETHLMSPVLISFPSKINSLFHHWVVQMQEMKCLGQVQNVEGLERPGNIPLPFSCAPWQLWMCVGGSSLDTALSSFLVVPGQKMLLFVITWQVQFPLTQQKRLEPTNSCNNSRKCQKKKKKKSVTIPGPSGSCHSKRNNDVRKLSQLQAPDPSLVQGWNLVFYIKLLQPPLNTLNKNSFCLNFSWHHKQNSSNSD